MKTATAGILTIIIAMAMITLSACTSNSASTIEAVQPATVPEVTVGDRVITAKDVEAAYRISVHINEVMSGDESKDKLQVLNELVTQQVIAAMFEDQGLEISQDDIKRIESAYSDFEAHYQDAIARGNESEIAYIEQLKAVIDNAQQASVLTEEEFEAFNIEQAKIVLMRSRLLHEKYDGDTAALLLAIEEFVSSQKIKIEGAGYDFVAAIGD